MTGRITAMGFEEVLVGVVRAGGSGGAGGGADPARPGGRCVGSSRGLGIHP